MIWRSFHRAHAGFARPCAMPALIPQQKVNKIFVLGARRCFPQVYPASMSQPRAEITLQTMEFDVSQDWPTVIPCMLCGLKFAPPHAGGPCMKCDQIDPLSFALAAYDPFGRVRAAMLVSALNFGFIPTQWCICRCDSSCGRVCVKVAIAVGATEATVVGFVGNQT